MSSTSFQCTKVIDSDHSHLDFAVEANKKKLGACENNERDPSDLFLFVPTWPRSPNWFNPFFEDGLKIRPANVACYSLQVKAVMTTLLLLLLLLLLL